MQFLAQVLQVQTPHGSSRHGSKSHIYARDPLIQMRLDHTELDYESDKEEEYQYEHGYETLI